MVVYIYVYICIDWIIISGDALICIWPPPPNLLINKFEREYKKLEEEMRRIQKKKLSRHYKKNKNNSKWIQIEKEFIMIKDKYSNEKIKLHTEQKKHLENSTHLATQCALEIQEEFGEMNFEGALVHESRSKKQNEEEAITLRVKIGIGVGKISVLIVGGILLNMH